MGDRERCEGRGTGGGARDKGQEEVRGMGQVYVTREEWTHH